MAQTSSRTSAEEPDGRQLSPLLCARRERPRHRSAAEQRDELAPPHRGTSMRAAKPYHIIGHDNAVVHSNKIDRLMTASGQKPPWRHVASNVRFARKRTRLGDL